MGIIRRSQVEKIKTARQQDREQNTLTAGASTREERARTAATLDALQRNSTEEEWRQAYTEHPLS